MVRKRLRVVFAVLIVSGCLVSTSAAQWTGPGFPSPTTVLNRYGLKGTFWVGYYHNRVKFGGDQDNPLSGSVNIPFIFSANPIVSYSGATIDYVLQGVALGWTCEGTMGPLLPGPLSGVGFIGKSWYFINAGRGHAREHWNTYVAPPLTSVGDGATWDVVPDWWRIEAYLTDNLANGVDILAGLRWEHFYTKFKNPIAPHQNPQSTNFGGVTTNYPVPFHSPDDEAEVGGEGLIPVIGLRFNYGTGSTKLNVSAVGMPAFVKGFGLTRFKTTMGEVGQDSVNHTGFRYSADGQVVAGYMFELAADYTTMLTRIGRIGAFFKWYKLEAKVQFDTPHIAFALPFQTQYLGQFTSPFTSGGSGTGTMYQSCITVGAMWSTNFQIPSL